MRSSIGQLHLISDDGDPVKVLSIRSIRSICQMEKFPIDSTSAVVDRTIGSLSKDDGDAEDDVLSKMNLYFTSKIRDCLDLCSMLVALKMCSS